MNQCEHCCQRQCVCRYNSLAPSAERSRAMKLATDDHIICAYAEHASGPGWSNTPIWVIIRDARDGSLRQECIQPDEQTAEMDVLYQVSSAAHNTMTAVVRSEAKRFQRKR